MSAARAPLSSADLVAQVRDEITRLGGAATPLVLAVSGGGDSLALLNLASATVAHELLVVAHVDHATRATSRMDLEFVREQAAHARLRFVAKTLAPLPASERRSEAAMRAARYDFLALVARTHGGMIVTAHTKEDHAETVLANLLRGAGFGGLSGIKEQSEWRVGGGIPVAVLRPLLAFHRDDLKEYLRELGLTPREDPTNFDGSNLRARLRAEVLPAIARATGRNPHDGLLRLAERARSAARHLDAELADLPPGAGRLALQELDDLQLDFYLHRLGVRTSAHVARARAAIRSGAPSRISLPHDRVLEITDQNVCVTQLSPPPPRGRARGL